MTERAELRDPNATHKPPTLALKLGARAPLREGVSRLNGGCGCLLFGLAVALWALARP